MFVSVYQDKVKGILPESRFKLLADKYEQEQEELRNSIEALTAELEKQEEQSENIEHFIEKVHKYFDLQELTPTILNDMVKRIYVHAPQKINGKRTQEIDIYYDLVGFLPQSLFETKNRKARLDAVAFLKNILILFYVAPASNEACGIPSMVVLSKSSSLL